MRSCTLLLALKVMKNNDLDVKRLGLEARRTVFSNAVRLAPPWR